MQVVAAVEVGAQAVRIARIAKRRMEVDHAVGGAGGPAIGTVAFDEFGSRSATAWDP